jgi:SecD/SecF fusion protein
MQGKGIIKFFAFLLAAVCLYQLSFTWVAQKVENDASKYAKGNLLKEKAYLDSMDNQPVYPILGWKYQYVKDKKLALGLDLKGGMDVTMQVSLVELIKALSNNNADPAFNQALESAQKISITNSSDFVVLFVKEYERIAPNGKLAAIFSTKDNESHLKFNATDSQVISYLQDQASVAVTQAKTVLNTRIDQFGVVQPNIQIQHGNQILIELPGVSDEDRVRKLLQGSANLEFYETYENADFFQILSNADKVLAAKLKATKTDTTAKTATAAKATIAAADTSKKSQALALLSKLQKNAGKEPVCKSKSIVCYTATKFLPRSKRPNIACTGTNCWLRGTKRYCQG